RHRHSWSPPHSHELLPELHGTLLRPLEVYCTATFQQPYSLPQKRIPVCSHVHTISVTDSSNNLYCNYRAVSASKSIRRLFAGTLPKETRYSCAHQPFVRLAFSNISTAAVLRNTPSS